MKHENLKELLIEELKDIYSAENQLVKALPKMAKAATSQDLKAGFEKHLEETRGHVKRLDRACDLLKASPKGSKCLAMEGLIKEGKEIVEDHDDPETLDAALICAAQKVEHYEIASYGTVRRWAELLGLKDVVKLLESTLNEEKSTDDKLSQMAESINVEAIK